MFKEAFVISKAAAVTNPVYGAILGCVRWLHEHFADPRVVGVIEEVVQGDDEWLAGLDAHDLSQCHAW